MAMSMLNPTGFVVETCYSCRLPFAMTAEFHAARQRDGGRFWCPLGHSQVYGETVADRLQKALDAATRERDFYRNQRQHAEHTARALRGSLTKLKQRVASGVCPCCQRTFAQLARHMKSKHPDFGPARKGIQ